MLLILQVANHKNRNPTTHAADASPAPLKRLGALEKADSVSTPFLGEAPLMQTVGRFHNRIIE